MRFGVKLGGAGHDRGWWSALLLMLVAVLAPTVCLLWFMNEAVNSQRAVARQKLAEAYRGQLALVRDRLDSYWEKRAADLDRYETSDPAALFERCVRDGATDAVICLNRDGSVAYPAPVASPAADPVEFRSDWANARGLENTRGGLTAAAAAYAKIASDRDDSVAARAVQAQIRCLVQSGDKEAAIRAIQQQFGAGRLARATDLQGRLIAADARLLLLSLISEDDPRYTPSARLLQAMLAGYDRPALPSAQRLFLMEEMRALKPGGTTPEFPTLDAERLAARFLESDRARAGDAVLRLSGATDIWKLTSEAGRIIALYRGATVLSAVRRFLNEQNSPQDLQFDITPPGAKPAPYDEWTPAGPRLPGWQITLALKGVQPFDEIERRQKASYLWIGFLAIATMAVLALIAGQAFRRQWRLARLKTDLVATVSHELKTPLASIRLLVDALLDDREFDARKTREYLELIARENLRLSRVIDNFLTFSRMERNRQSFEFTETEPQKVAQAAVEACRERFHCPLDLDVSPGLPSMRADEGALVTVLLNLLDNAYKYTPGEKRIGLRAYRESGRVCFAVQDNGIGIAPREQKRIFRKFYQVDRRLARHAGGCGLGLSIVEFIVSAHGGIVEVKSQPGAGSTFTVSLPTAEGSAA